MTDMSEIKNGMVTVPGTDFAFFLQPDDPSDPFDSTFPLDYDYHPEEESVTFGAGKHHFTSLDYLTHDYDNPDLYAALIVDLDYRHLYVDVCNRNNPYPTYESRFPIEVPFEGSWIFKPEIRFPISRFVTKKRLFDTFQDPKFGKSLQDFASDPENVAKKTSFGFTVADFLNEFELYVIDKPKIISDLIEDLVEKSIPNGEDLDSVRLHLIACQIMSLHGSDYIDGTMYITFG